MRLLEKIKALIGLSNGARGEKSRDSVDVTVEREPDRGPDPESTMSPSDPAGQGVDEERADRPESDTEPEPSEGVPADTEPEPDQELEPEQEPETELEPEPEREPEREPEQPLEPEPESGSAPDTAPDTDAAEPPEAPTEDEQAATEPNSGPAEGGDERPLDSIKGIGPSYAERLENAGIESVGELATADPEALAGETGLSEKRISRWIERAQQG